MALLDLLRRKSRRTDECCGCGKTIPERKAVVITEEPKDDRRLGIVEGGTFMSATYCKKCKGKYVTS